MLKVFKFLNEKLLRTGNSINNCLIPVFQHLAILSITGKKKTMTNKPRFYLNVKLTISKSCKSCSLFNIILFPCTTRKGLWQFEWIRLTAVTCPPSHHQSSAASLSSKEIVQWIGLGNKFVCKLTLQKKQQAFGQVSFLTQLSVELWKESDGSKCAYGWNLVTPTLAAIK